MRRKKKMIVYVQVVEKKIVSIDSENYAEGTYKVECNSVDEFYQKVEGIGEITEEVEEQIRDLFDTEKEDTTISNYQIKHWVSNRSFGELIDMYECGEIKKPDMQREFVWDSAKSSRLIESIILGLPIPPLFLLEIDNNKYELIDGYQRLTTVTNYVMGYPWNRNNTGKKKSAAKLSGNIRKDLVGRTFEKLSEDDKRKIKRSTIPLIEFRQIQPDDMNSKYLIFERINTGSEKLNPMQIRKSLAYGEFIKELYEKANQCEELKSLFSIASIKQDSHVEAYLRTYAMIKIVYYSYEFDKTGLNNILNSFCESHRNVKIEEEFSCRMQEAILLMRKVFERQDKMFRRVEIDGEGNYYFVGNMNISIMEAMLGVCIQYSKNISNIDPAKIRDNYCQIMSDVIKRAITREEENPFSTSTGTKTAINNRFTLCEKIMEIQ